MKKCGEKEKRTYTRKNKQENACSQSHDATSHSQFTYKILTFCLEQLLRNLLRKITVLIAWRERKDHKYKEEQTGQSWLSFSPYNMSLLFCIPNMNFLSYIPYLSYLPHMPLKAHTEGFSGKNA